MIDQAVIAVNISLASSKSLWEKKEKGASAINPNCSLTVPIYVITIEALNSIPCQTKEQTTATMNFCYCLLDADSIFYTCSKYG